MRGYLIGGAVAALAIASVAAAAQTAPPPGVAQGTAPAPMAPPPGAPHVRMMFGGEHVMTRDEVAKHVGELFARLDTNHDGFVTKEEVEAIHQKMMGAMGMASRMPDHEMPMPDRGAMFDRLDTNHDGNISRQEFMASKPQVREERVMIMRGPDGAAAGMHRMHAMGDMHGMHAMHMGGMAIGGHMFEMADANHDGRVSLAEAQAAALAHFDKADLNHDGKITPDEHQQIREQIRIERRPS
jgi:Ca2+-binding EF-hand superfamily protein